MREINTRFFRTTEKKLSINISYLLEWQIFIFYFLNGKNIISCQNLNLRS